MSKRQVFRYTVPVDDRPHVIHLTNDPLHVANGVTLDEVEFWAEHDMDALEYPAAFQVVGTGHQIPDGARYVGTPDAGGTRMAPVQDSSSGGCSMTRLVYLTGQPFGLHTYTVQRFRMKPDRPLTFSDGERIIAVLRSDVVLGGAYESDMIDIVALVELPRTAEMTGDETTTAEITGDPT